MRSLLYISVILYIEMLSAVTKCHTSFTSSRLYQKGYPSTVVATVRILLTDCFAKHTIIKGGMNYWKKGQGRVVVCLCRLSVRNSCWSNTSEGKEQFFKLFIELALKFLFLTVECTAKRQEPSLKEKNTAPIVR